MHESTALPTPTPAPDPVSMAGMEFDIVSEFASGIVSKSGIVSESEFASGIATISEFDIASEVKVVSECVRYRRHAIARLPAILDVLRRE
jgi:hypothetical protein